MSKKNKNKNSKENINVFYIFLTAFFIAVISVVIYKSSTVQELLFSGSVHHDVIVTAPLGKLDVEIATTQLSQERGLSFKKSINENEGMLFIFNTPGKYGFWMKDMNFPLDMFWINEDGIVVSMQEDIATSTYPNVFINDSQAKYVLELNTGSSKKFGIFLGTKLNIGQY